MKLRFTLLATMTAGCATATVAARPQPQALIGFGESKESAAEAERIARARVLDGLAPAIDEAAKHKAPRRRARVPSFAASARCARSPPRC